MPAPIDFSNCKKIVFLTGAGISKASGLQTFRGDGGIWDELDINEVGTAEAMRQDPLKVWRTYVTRLGDVAQAKPNAAHHAIADLERRLGDECWVCVLTQNVDGLHQQAGSSSVLEAHGSLRRLRCTKCDAKPWPLEGRPTEQPPACPACGAQARFDIVLFGEMLDPMFGLKALAFIGDADYFFSVGTSDLVAPASQLIEIAEEAGARTVCINPEPTRNRYDEFIPGKAEEILPVLLGAE